MPAKIIAGSIGLTGFAAAILAGLAAGNPAVTILRHALVAMIACWVIGIVVGAVAFHAVAEHVERYKRENPVKDPALLARLQSQLAAAEPDTEQRSPIEVMDAPDTASPPPRRQQAA